MQHGYREGGVIGARHQLQLNEENSLLGTVREAGGGEQGFPQLSDNGSCANYLKQAKPYY